MAHITATSTPQIEADRRLLQFETYEDYLDSLITEQDRCYLQDTVAARTIAEFGYRYTSLLRKSRNCSFPVGVPVRR